MSLYEWDDDIKDIDDYFVHVCRELSRGDGRSPKSSVPSVHIDRLKSRNDLPIRSRSLFSSSSFLN